MKKRVLLKLRDFGCLLLKEEIKVNNFEQCLQKFLVNQRDSKMLQSSFECCGQISIISAAGAQILLFVNCTTQSYFSWSATMTNDHKGQFCISYPHTRGINCHLVMCYIRTDESVLNQFWILSFLWQFCKHTFLSSYHPYYDIFPFDNCQVQCFYIFK